MPVFTEKTLGDTQLYVPASSSFDLLQACTVACFHASAVDKDVLCGGQSAYFPTVPLQKATALLYLRSYSSTCELKLMDKINSVCVCK